MSINLITQPGATTPVYNTDYTQQNLLINGALAQSEEILTDWATTAAAPSIKQGTYIYHSGNLYSVDSADESISGALVSGVNYIGLTASGTVLTASYVSDISGYTYNPAYAGLYNGSILIIKAVVYLSGTVYNRGISADRNMSGVFLLADGRSYSNNAVVCSTVNTGQGANELYAMDQNVLTTSSPTFASVNASAVSTGSIIASGAITPTSTATYLLANIAAGGSYVLPRGLYMVFNNPSGVHGQYYSNILSTWIDISDDGEGATMSFLASDGVHARLHNEYVATLSGEYYKY